MERPCRTPTPTRTSRCCRTGRRFVSSTPSTRSFRASYIEARYSRHRRRVLPVGPLPRQPGRSPVCSSSKRSRRPARSRSSCDGRYEGKLALFGGVEKVRFRRVVRPGDELLLVVESRSSARAAAGARRGHPSTARPPAKQGCSSRLPNYSSLATRRDTRLAHARSWRATRSLRSARRRERARDSPI